MLVSPAATGRRSRRSRRAGTAVARTMSIVTVALLVAACGGTGGSVTTPAASRPAGSAPSGTAPSGAAPSSGAPGAGTPAGTAPGAGSGVATGAPVPSPGCGSSTVGAVDAQKVTMTVGGADRFYLLYTPAAHDGHTPLPLVFDFHGLAEGAEVHTKMSGFGAVAEKEGFVAVFPNGQGQPLHWDTNPAHQPNQDLAFFDAMLERVERDLCVDTSRVYATGLSYGAIMTSFLLCTRSTVLAAAAPVAGLQMPDGCAPERHVPILTFHGTADPILRFDGTVGDLTKIFSGKKDDGPTTSTVPPDLDGPGYPAHVAAWAKAEGCDPKPTDTKVSASVVHRAYSCPPGSAVEFDIVLGGGHAWPGSEFSKSIESIVGVTTFEIDATQEAWHFFRRFQRTG